MTPQDKINKDTFSEKIGEKEKRKIRAINKKKPNAWSGLGMFGMVGWSVSVPTLLGAGLGIWLDKRFQQSFSWTLTCLVAGLFVGCVIAWNWIAKEDKKMHQDNEE